MERDATPNGGTVVKRLFGTSPSSNPFLNVQRAGNKAISPTLDAFREQN
jgi:hypothetical protein